jgi:murein DD-endopeptidase MepM/ murein hydrolase activator NlpD
VLGGMPRLMKTGRMRLAIPMALGAGILVLTRPYEGLLLCLPVAVVLGRWALKGEKRPAAAALMRGAVLPTAIVVATVLWLGYYDYRACVAVAALLIAGAQEPPGTIAVTLTPAVVVAGAPELIRVTAPGAAQMSGEWLGQKIDFFRGRDAGEWFALAGVDVEGTVGPSTLEVSVTPSAGGAAQSGSAGSARTITRTIEIHAAHYRTGVLTVAPEFVQPPPEVMDEIKAEILLKDKVFGTSAAEPLWRGDFRAPVQAAPTDSFGTRRTFNGKLASVHKGMDFRAATGTPVHAGNAGVVVLARKMYYEGNCVAIDHGLGLYTISMHLSRIDVHEGERVTKGQLIGLSGATGRVTGPHLHWAVRWEGAYLDPAKLLKMDLSGVR